MVVVEDEENVSYVVAMALRLADFEVIEIEELVARTRAILRRRGADAETSVLICGELSVDEDAHRVTIGSRPIALSPTGYERFLWPHLPTWVLTVVATPVPKGVAMTGSRRKMGPELGICP
ncbi:hypothetical protein MXD62_22620 [Frankia sp. Mgl5]|uniref:hypothetical protein n=1 Tax=Frankia sp. Mgl5 TaxID=2933793 RepID=UPI00200EAFA1|nr:hypothetical protein [Frankia sp. Mgl5]MCK9929922.1 hypothetical protein [Frankia sp. Mgl5]